MALVISALFSFATSSLIPLPHHDMHFTIDHLNQRITWYAQDHFTNHCYHPCKDSWFFWENDVATVRHCSYCGVGGQCCTGQSTKFHLHRCSPEFVKAAEEFYRLTDNSNHVCIYFQYSEELTTTTSATTSTASATTTTTPTSTMITTTKTTTTTSSTTSTTSTTITTTTTTTSFTTTTTSTTTSTSTILTSSKASTIMTTKKPAIRIVESTTTEEDTTKDAPKSSSTESFHIE
ncbi:unnamed protein product [Oikopleura dioica]|uniref:Uncharacterized protein n=1 Tax=Oikopleura dioica TaxID=34765 RepID=E4YR78_OIKDI|nr:unnamed protein product [Oikopleura dioica]